ncbi:unnamed protein product [Callosobruchus maculatus]|uniref:Folylpolyglutamate synthase n=1 Tax=Callosobruchus maculatus TaxID=64391 RepID=A0A653BXM1_CALMS|nr:unnamed protein product [Callosobruchus maculatus]
MPNPNTPLVMIIFANRNVAYKMSICLNNNYGQIITSLITVVRSLSSMSKKALPHTENRDYETAINTLNQLQSNAQYIQNAALRPTRTGKSGQIVEMTKFLYRSGLALEDLDKLSVIHVAGTNGKGSTCAYSEAILRCHGYKTGFFSSPHCIDVRERIRINGIPIPKSQFANHFWNIYDKLDAQKDHEHDMPMYFRFLTLLAFHVFLEEKVSVAILEVGIGGEYDCTNIVRKTVVAAITSLDFDHTQLLGDTIDSIAWNKSGIMKAGSIAFTVPQPETALKVLRDRSHEKHCDLHIVNEDPYGINSITDFAAEIQKKNAGLALAICEAFIKKDPNGNGRSFSLDLAKNAIAQTKWPGRYEIISHRNSRFFIDGAHTLKSMVICRKWFEEKTKGSSWKKALIFNLMGCRDPRLFFYELRKLDFDTVIFCPNVGSDKDPADSAGTISDQQNNVCPKDVQLEGCATKRDQWLKMNPSSKNVQVFPSFLRASDYLTSQDQWDVLVTGSIHLVGAAMTILDQTLKGTLE